MWLKWVAGLGKIHFRKGKGFGVRSFCCIWWEFEKLTFVSKFVTNRCFGMFTFNATPGVRGCGGPPVDWPVQAPGRALRTDRTVRTGLASGRASARTGTAFVERVETVHVNVHPGPNRPLVNRFLPVSRSVSVLPHHFRFCPVVVLLGVGSGRTGGIAARWSPRRSSFRTGERWC